MAKNPWTLKSERAKSILETSIPKQWLCPPDKLPKPTELDVHDFPRESGLLAPSELAITEMSATALVREMGAGKLSAEEVVVAFLKRGVIGQQLVCLILFHNI